MAPTPQMWGMLNEIWKTRFWFKKWNPVLHIRQTKFNFSFSLRKLHKITKCQVKLIHTFLMSSVYKSFHQTAKYGRQRNHILQQRFQNFLGCGPLLLLNIFNGVKFTQMEKNSNAIRGHPFMMSTRRGSGSGGRLWTGESAPCGRRHRK